MGAPAASRSFPVSRSFLLGLPGVDREEIRGYFVKHGLVERFDELERAMAAAEPR